MVKSTPQQCSFQKLLVTVCSQAGETNCAERIRAYLGCVKGEENERRAAALKESDGIINDQIASCFTGSVKKSRPVNFCCLYYFS